MLQLVMLLPVRARCGDCASCWAANLLQAIHMARLWRRSVQQEPASASSACEAVMQQARLRSVGAQDMQVGSNPELSDSEAG